MTDYDWIIYFAIPAAAPVVTVLVEKFGSEKTQQRWLRVRNVYRRALGMDPVK